MRRVALFGSLGVLAALGGCMVAPRSFAHDIAHLLLIAMTVGVASLAAACLYEAYRHQRLVSGMDRLAHRGTLSGQRVEFVPGLSGPFVAGLWAPRIYCGDDLSMRLDKEEIRAVMLHEQHHQRDRAPLRLVTLSALTPILAQTQAGRAWTERELARIEIAADTHALAAGVTRPAIASALLKLSAGPALTWAPGFATAADLRVRALLGEPTGLDLDRRPTRIVPAVLVVVACLVVYLA